MPNINGLPAFILTMIMQFLMFMTFILLCTYVYDLLFPNDLCNIELSYEEYQERLRKETQGNDTTRRKTGKTGRRDVNKSRNSTKEEKFLLRQALRQKEYVERRYVTLDGISHTTAAL